MKIKLLTVMCVFTLFGSSTSTFAADDRSLDVVFDVGLVRPGCFVATAAGTALFVAILPLAAISKSMKQTAHTLVTVPAKATFTRPVGDFSSIEQD